MRVVNAGIDANDLSRLKGGKRCLKESDIERLSKYLDAVVIPQWNTISSEKKKATKFEIL